MLTCIHISEDLVYFLNDFNLKQCLYFSDTLQQTATFRQSLAGYVRKIKSSQTENNEVSKDMRSDNIEKWESYATMKSTMQGLAYDAELLALLKKVELYAKNISASQTEVQNRIQFCIFLLNMLASSTFLIGCAFIRLFVTLVT